MTPTGAPDFICIGMPKAGTRWLYDQLDHNPDFWMPPVKELHYLHREAPTLRNTKDLLQRWDDVERRARKKGFAWGERERGFLEDLLSCAGQPRDLGRYATLFRYKGDRLSGDISPGYCSIENDSVIAELASSLPHTKILLLVREPIARVWSRICMSEREGSFDLSVLDDTKRFMKFLERRRYIRGRSMPTQIVRRWASDFSQGARFRVILFDDIVCKPAETITEILRFVGVDAPKPGGIPAGHNRKSKVRKMQMPDPIRQVLIDHFASEILACASLFGGAAQSWPSLYGL